MTVYMHTPSAGGVVVRNGKLLTITSSRRGTVDLPKGTIEPGESIEEAALREVEEETGYRTAIIDTLGSKTYDFNGRDGKRYRKTVSYFLMEPIDEDEPIKNLQEGEDFENEWLTFEEALEKVSFIDTRTIIQKAKEVYAVN